MDSLVYTTIIIILGIVFILTIASVSTPQVEGFSGGFSTITSLAFYNRDHYSDPGDCYPEAAYSGGTYLPHRVIL